METLWKLDLSISVLIPQCVCVCVCVFVLFGVTVDIKTRDLRLLALNAHFLLNNNECVTTKQIPHL